MRTKHLGQETRTTGNSPVRVREPSVCRHLSQVCRGARFGDPVHADVASGPRVGISAGIPARVRGVRDSGGGSAPDPEDSQIGSGIDYCVDDCRNSQSHFRVGIWLVLFRCSHGDAAGCHLSLADTQALPLGRIIAVVDRQHHSPFWQLWGFAKRFGSLASG